MEKARSRGRDGNHGPRARRRRRAARGLPARRRHLRPRMQHNRRGAREAAPRYVPDDTSGRSGAEPERPRAAARGIAESLRALPSGQRRHNAGIHPRARAHGRLRARADRVRRPSARGAAHGYSYASGVLPPLRPRRDSSGQNCRPRPRRQPRKLPRAPRLEARAARRRARKNPRKPRPRRRIRAAGAEADGQDAHARRAQNQARP